MGIQKCCVGGCNATSETHRLFSFPKNNYLRNQWLSFLVPTNASLLGLSKEQLLRKRVCVKHFDKHQFDNDGRRLRYSYPCLLTNAEIAHGIPLNSAAGWNITLDHNYFKEQDEKVADTNSCIKETETFTLPLPTNSGQQKPLKRVREGFGLYHDDEGCLKVSRSDEKKKPVNEEIVIDNSTSTKNSTSTVKSEPEVDPLEIDWVQADSFEFEEEADPNNCLSGISGYRIVDLKHVIEWAFRLERHRNMCESSKIELVSERIDGFQSILIFKCSKCNKTWRCCTESSNKINSAFGGQLSLMLASTLKQLT